MEILTETVSKEYIRNVAENIYGDDFIEFDSMINIRPRQHNSSRDVENPEIRSRIIALVNQFIR